jgi:hypothetical protein
LQERAWIEKAIALDPHYAQAYSALAGNYSGGVLFGWSENRGEDSVGDESRRPFRESNQAEFMNK